MDNKILAIVVVLVLVGAGAGVFVAVNDKGGDESDADSITVVDACDRTLEIPLPVNKVAIFDTGSLDVFATAVGENWADYVCMMPADIDIREKAKADLIYTAHPELKDLPKAPFLFNQDGGLTLPAPEVFMSANPDLILLDGSPLGYYTDGKFSDWMDNIGKAIAPIFATLFYGKSFQPGVCEANYGGVGKIMGTSEHADKVADLYNSTMKTIKDKIADSTLKDFQFYVELQFPNIKDSYGQVAGAGCPEVELLGGKNINQTGMHDMDWNLSKMFTEGHPGGPDYIVIVNTSYAGADALLGYGNKDISAGAQSILDEYKQRDGWSDLDAVKNNNMFLYYGELRNSAFGLVDLCNMAAYFYPELFDESLAQGVITAFNELCPWGFEGNWMYVPAA